MADTSAELRRALSIVEGPLRFAQKSDHALLSLRGFGGLVAKAMADVRRLPLSAAQTESVRAISEAAAPFDQLGLEARRKTIALIAEEIAGLGGNAVPAPPAPFPQREGGDEPSPSRSASDPDQLGSTLPSLSGKGAGGIGAPEPSPSKRIVDTVELTKSLSTLKGIGPAIASKLASRGLVTMGDVLLYLPRSYEDRRELLRISQTVDGQHALVQGRIVAFHEKFARRKIYELEIEDDSGILTARWFGFRPGAFRSFVPGVPVVISGTVRLGLRERREIIHPDLEVGEQWDDEASFGRIIPVYTEVEGLSARAYRRIAHRVVDACAHLIPDFLAPEFRAAHNLVELSVALRAVHFPDESADFKQLLRFNSPAQRRLVFDELFFVQLGLAQKKRGQQIEPGIPLRADEEILGKATTRLPFSLTGAQCRSLNEIAHDLSRPTPMNRLLQGDVGSGKTAVALAAALVAVENGYQAAVMAPTELLAEQHYKTFEKLLGSNLFEQRRDQTPVRVGLLAASRKPKELQRTKNELASGTTRIAIGTHALIQEGVEFSKLGVVIIDEQHRFGVVQRARLMEKGQKPHVLVMTATPIPRTLALTLYGDLDVSIIDELPPGRTPITTKLFSGKTRGKAYDLVRKEIELGHQAYVVLPLVEESEKLDLRAATEEAERLQREEFAGSRVGLVHGRMSSEERNHAMELFRRGEIHVLVATTVIEVGVDVPNASAMLIEHAERFGLSQLHQLRGRVGRGAAKSYCLLVAEEDKSSENARERISVMVRTNNGFELAEADLEIRGPGEFLGTRQSGLPDLVVADLLRDQMILKEAREAAFVLVQHDPDFRRPEHHAIARELERRWAGKLSLARIG